MSDRPAAAVFVDCLLSFFLFSEGEKELKKIVGF